MSLTAAPVLALIWEVGWRTEKSKGAHWHRATPATPHPGPSFIAGTRSRNCDHTTPSGAVARFPRKKFWASDAGASSRRVEG